MSTSQEIPSVMRAIYVEEYGAPKEVLQLKTVPVPQLKPGHVLIKVKATSTHAGDWHLIRGTPWFIRLLFGGIRRPKYNIPGCDMCGVIRDKSDDVSDEEFKINDEVFGDLSGDGFGTFAEYLIAPVKSIAKKPKNISIQHASVSCVSAIAALQTIRDGANITPDAGKKQRLLINGASGGVGTFLIQFANYFSDKNIEIWAVCHKRKADIVKKVGAHHIVDYTIQDVLDLNESFDIIIDTACYHNSPVKYCKMLNPNGKLIVLGGATSRFLQMMVFGPWISFTRNIEAKFFETKPSKKDLELVAELLSKGIITPHIDKQFTLENVPEAIAYIESRKVTGKVAILV